MADRCKGAVSFTPIVTLAADNDADAVDAIHHNIGGSLGGPCTYEQTNAGDVWFYAPNVIVTSSCEELIGAVDDATDLVGASGDQVNGPNEAAGALVEFTNTAESTNRADTSADFIRFLFVKNTGVSNTSGTTTTNSVYMTFDANSSTANNTADAIEIGAGEAWVGRVNAVMKDIFVITGQARAAGTAATVNGSTSVKCTVAAMVDDSSV